MDLERKKERSDLIKKKSAQSQKQVKLREGEGNDVPVYAYYSIRLVKYRVLMRLIKY